MSHFFIPLFHTCGKFGAVAAALSICGQPCDALATRTSWRTPSKWMASERSWLNEKSSSETAGSFRVSEYIIHDKLASDLDALAPPRLAKWSTISQLLIADIVGPAVMAVTNAFAALGWVMGIIFCVLMLPLNIYCGLLVWHAQVQEHPGTLTLADVSHAALGSAGYWLAGVSVYSFIVMVLGFYVLTLGECLQLLFYRTTLSSRLWSLIGAAALLPLTQLRTLNGTRLLLLINNITLIACVVSVLVHLWSGGAIADGYAGSTALVAKDLSWRSFASGLSTLAFAYVGVLLYPEL